jgi:pSer/pThr/pTyr-binding forkhead associated (FHA) protein
MQNELEDSFSEHEASGENNAIPEQAFLIVEGMKIFPLNRSVISLGRRFENTLVLNDPRVSRIHAQLRAFNGRYVLFDLQSRGGTFINGKKIDQSVVYDGDVISLAGVELIFKQNNPPPRPDLRETVFF